MAERALRPATYADFEAVPPHLAAEIIDGTLEMHPRPRPRHGVATNQLSYELEGPFGRGRRGGGGWIFIVEPELHLGPDVVVPDLAGWRTERLATEAAEALITVPPDWLCVVLSPSTARLDRGAKRRIYANAAVRHLWLLEPTAGELESFELSGRQWLLLATVQRGEEVRVPPFDAVSLPLDDLFPFDRPAAPPSTEA